MALDSGERPWPKAHVHGSVNETAWPAFTAKPLNLANQLNYFHLFQRSYTMKHPMLAASALSLLLGAAAATSAGAYPHHDWHKGGRIADTDWRRGAKVDWHSRHLRAPPRGYEWRDVDGNYVLAALAGGAIADLIAHS
jgi:Ni/Co efflux regulator RcnB